MSFHDICVVLLSLFVEKNKRFYSCSEMWKKTNKILHKCAIPDITKMTRGLVSYII